MTLLTLLNEQSLLLGFYDPYHGKRKVLRVEYSFRGELHRAEVEDTAPLVAPLHGESNRFTLLLLLQLCSRGWTWE